MKTIDYSFFIERYNAGEMNDAEKSWFIKELNGSRELQEEVALRKKTDDILRNKNVLQLRGKLVEIEKKRASNLPCKKRRNHLFKYAAAIAGFILLGSIALINVKNFGSDEIYNRYYEAYAIETCTPSRSAAIGTASDIDYQTAVDYYNVSDYTNAALFFSKVLDKDPANMESRMLYGVSNFEQNNYPVAEGSFSEVIKDNNNFYIEAAQWYLAWCYIMTDEKSKAIDQLTLIRNSPSLYKNKAKKVLRKIK
jgi:TolA-binding protein